MPTLQTICVEYRVSGSLDGVTPAPTFSMNPRSSNYLPPDEDNIFIVRISENLGLIDPTFLTGLSYADRFIKHIVIYGPNNPTDADNVRVVTRDNNGNLVALKNALTIPAASQGVYSKRCIFVPQGGLLQVRAMDGGGGVPVVVRIGVWQPDSLNALAAMRQACCCREGGIFPNPNPPPADIDINTFPVGVSEACQRTITDVDPDPIGNGDVVDVTITGTGFQAGDSVVFIDPVTMQTLSPSINIDSDTQITASFTAGSYGTLSSTTTFDLIIGPPDIPSCAATLEDALTVIVPG